MQPGDLPSPFVSFSCSLVTIRQISSTFVRPSDLPSTFSNFCAARRHSVNILCALLSTSVNIPCSRVIFRQFRSIFLADGRPSVNFCQLSVWPEDLLLTFLMAGTPSVTSDKLPFILESFCQLLSNFRAAGRLSVNLCQPWVRPGDL